MAWIVKLHAESYKKRKFAPFTFDEKLCVDLKYCEKWIDPAEREKKRLQEEAVFW